MNDKAQELTTKITESINALCAETDAAKQSAIYRAWLSTLSRFHNYSWGNCLLIWTQCPGSYARCRIQHLEIARPICQERSDRRPHSCPAHSQGGGGEERHHRAHIAPVRIQDRCGVRLRPDGRRTLTRVEHQRHRGRRCAVTPTGKGSGTAQHHPCLQSHRGQRRRPQQRWFDRDRGDARYPGALRGHCP